MAKAKKVRPKNANGDGSIRQRSDGKWELRITIGKKIDGKPIRKSLYGDKQSDVKLKYKEYLKNTEMPVDKTATVKEWALFWLEVYKKDKISYKGYYNYTLYINKHIIPEIGHLSLEQVRPAHIQKLFQEKQHFSYSAKNHVRMILRSMFKSAVKNNLCKSNPTEDIVIQRKVQSSPAIFTAEDISDILEAAKTHKYGFYVQALLYSGMRIGELLALRWRDIDFDNDTIHIHSALARSENGNAIKSTKTGRERYIGINENFKEILTAQHENAAEEFIVSTKNNSFVTLPQFNSRYRKFFKDNNLRYLSPHKCRHTYATFLIKGGVDLRTVQTLLGHVKINTTQIYTQVDMAMIKEGVSKLNF